MLVAGCYRVKMHVPSSAPGLLYTALDGTLCVTLYAHCSGAGKLQSFN